MPFRVYKSVRLGKGVRLNLSKTGVGLSAGAKGAGYSVHSSGRRTTSVGVPGTGVSYRKTTSSGSRSPSTRQAAPEPIAPVFPKVGMLAPKGDKAFVRGVTAYMQGNHEQAFAALGEARALDPDSRHVGKELFAGMSLVGLQRVSEAVPYFESVLASDHTIPDPIMAKYNVGGSIQISVTPLVMVNVPLSNVAVALILAEAYQLSDQRQKAIELLALLGAEAEDVAVFALSLADLYGEANEWNEVVRVTEGVQTNEDDVTLHVLTFRAEALNELGMTDGALAITKEALRTKKRLPELLRLARYIRGLAYEKGGRASMARKEFEKVYAEDARFADVAARLGLADAPPPRPRRYFLLRSSRLRLLRAIRDLGV